MLPTLHRVDDTCPWCGEALELSVDVSAGSTEYVEDCQICCAPIVVRITTGPEPAATPYVILEREGG
jgi:hypothetical protein